MHKDLSILICSIESRKNCLNRLLSILKPQINSNVEILIDVDNKEKTIGQKRNNLLEKACGKYVCYIDDDDIVSNNYIKLILNAIKYNEPDCVSIRGYWFLNNKMYKNIVWGKNYLWSETHDTYYIGSNHITPIKKDIALSCKFPLINVGEDFAFRDKLKRYLITESCINEPIYYYYQNRKNIPC